MMLFSNLLSINKILNGIESSPLLSSYLLDTSLLFHPDSQSVFDCLFVFVVLPADQDVHFDAVEFQLTSLLFF